MISRLYLLIALFLPLGGCYPIPHVEVSEHLDFDYVPAGPTSKTHDELMCCDKCEV